MSEAIYEALRAIQSDMTQVEVLAQGLANTNTAGFRAAQVSTRPFTVGSIEETSADPVIHVSEKSGAIVSTGRKLDIALAGDGFLQVETDSESMLSLVRGGSLQVADDGTLTTALGRPVLVDGARLVVEGGNVDIDPNGDIFVDGQLLGRLSIVELLDDKALGIADEGVYAAPLDAIDTEPPSTTVLQGYVEQSNVNSSESIIRMMELSKHVESVQRSLVALDQMLDSGINDIGRR